MTPHAIEVGAQERGAQTPITVIMNDLLADMLAKLSVSLNGAAERLRHAPTPAEDSAAELMRLAATYDATQPSYAADLRAAAMHHSRDERLAAH